jgi:hypothetical protein
MKAGLRTGIAAAAAAATLAWAGIAGAAPGDTTYTGETDEGANVKLTVAEFGNPTKFKIGKTKVECDEGGTLSNQPGTYTGLDRSDPGKFKDKRTLKNSAGGFDFKTKSKLKGAADNQSFSTWSGTLQLSTKVFEKGDLIDTCTLKTGWTAS